ncbi:MAG: hypothetical protein SHS37scaffold220_3 [Phage 67_12]|nr:MAG: hypothetical protein SHS37scaffold220_3 [Phage 67_12]
MMLPFLSDEEIAEICRPLRMPAAQRRHLARLGLLVKMKPNGQPLVARAEFERVMTGAPVARASEAEEDAATTPNVVGLEQWAKGRKRRGTSS